MNFEVSLMKAIANDDCKTISMMGIDEYTANEKFSKVVQIPQKIGELRIPSVSYPTPLVYAICCRAYKSVELLINLGANLLKDVQGWQPIHYAVLSHDVAIVRLLLSKDKELISSKSGSGATLLHFAVSCSDYEMVAFLLSNGCDVNAANNLKQTPFLLSMACNDIRIVKALVAFSSELDARDAKGKTYEDIATSHGKNEYIKYIKNIMKKNVQPETKESILESVVFEEPEQVEGVETEENNQLAQLDELEKHVKELEKKVGK